MSTSETRFCFHKLVVALAKSSLPGRITFPPTVSPEMDIIRLGSNVVPITVIWDIVYCLGALTIKILSSPPFTQTHTLPFVNETDGIESVCSVTRGRQSCLTWV